jgi:rhamnosyltransferase subunit B
LKRVLIATVGSFGDLHPYLAIAIGLKQRGHDVTLASCGRYREKVESEAIRFVAIPPHLDNLENDPEVRRRTMNTFDGTRYVVQEIFMPPLEEAYRILLAECEGADVALGSLFAMGLTLAAAKRGVPYLHTALQPAAVLSAYDPPLIPSAPFLPWLARFGPKPLQLVYGGLQKANAFLLKKAYELAAKEGLPESAVPPLFGASSPHGNLMLFSRHFMGPQPDFPEPLTMCGFPFYDKLDAGGGALEADLEAFLAAGPAPVVFTLGTSAVLDPGRFYSEAAVAMRKMGRRAVFLVGPTNFEEYRKLHGDEIFVALYAPHSQLMPRAWANVHQGGIGTTAQALRSGRPMIVVPFSHDQPDNARRCVRLGVGASIPRSRLNASRLAEALAALPRCEERALEMGRLIQAEDAVARACEKIEAIQPSSKGR